MRQYDYILDLMSLALQDATLLQVRGRVTQVVGTIIKAVVPTVKIGEVCLLRNPGEAEALKAEVVGLTREAALLTPIGELYGISAATEVVPTGRAHMVPVGNGLLGRVLDGLGQPLDIATEGALVPDTYYPVYADAPDPLRRRIIDRPLKLGVRALDGLLTCGEGQRIGIFAAAGGGKSTLMGMLVKGADVDVTVIALIGERGREVREFIENELGPEGRARAVIVCATSDKSSMERAKAAYVATAIAEFYRDQGKKVLFLMDSVTRFARALREIGLAAGEPPTRRGYPPSVFATLPRLMERVGMNDKGSITAMYTVLVEGDDMTEPVADETRSILDGHVVLSRKLAAANHYPAIDVLASASRVMSAVADPAHLKAAGKFRELLAKYAEIELLVKIGEYQPGADAIADEAIAKHDAMRGFLRQRTDEFETLDASISKLDDIAFGR
ncbi:type III secretion apparatus H+-transporting two-sector ATPase [Pandoraea pnomenusa]|uniref:Type 3 secretion system ATPase n=1 Tax=Pandoraea pnomenusa TaxID=93220 RepID=A0A378YW53_9BURK|nr:type III secretion system ATPase SctN [Pandoraea pnomenusa]AHB07176.1 ATP synthase [Pandoraea pnomenusa 3kgm]AIU28475.1 type III secretion apparatus H+-transporting two-sector ATPase [Pandoraea pnomenusa]MBN9096148.1 type III secretion system ATPase SctN [Pandoraea pnomenusa]SUA80671.1 Probable ATP synthase YscN [Pandoraea pnomenusa]